MNQTEMIDRIAAEVIRKLQTGGPAGPAHQADLAGHSGIAVGMRPVYGKEEMAQYIDHTLLKPESTAAQFDQVCREAIQYKFKSLCVNSGWVPYVYRKLQGTGVAICSVVGFPLGAMSARCKGLEARDAVSSGAAEIDMVINIGALRSGMYDLVEEDIRVVRRATRATTVLKVIIETSMLNQEEKVLACQISKKAGADFVKTSTGFGGGGATAEDIALMRSIVGPDMGVKASGGIRSWDKAVEMLGAGANRLGVASSVKVMTGGVAEGAY